MNILFLTLAYSNTRNIYSDLMQEFENMGNDVWVVCQNERRNAASLSLVEDNGHNMLTYGICFHSTAKLCIIM